MTFRPLTREVPPAEAGGQRRIPSGLAAVLPAIALGACVAAPGAPVPAGASSVASDVQCTTERPTGSMLPVRVCTTKAERAAIDRATRETNQALQRLPGRACPGTPGCTTS